MHPPKGDGAAAQTRRREIDAARQQQADLAARARVVQMHLDVMQGGRPRSDP